MLSLFDFYKSSLVLVLVIQIDGGLEEPGVRRELNFSLHTRNLICLHVEKMSYGTWIRISHFSAQVCE